MSTSYFVEETLMKLQTGETGFFHFNSGIAELKVIGIETMVLNMDEIKLIYMCERVDGDFPARELKIHEDYLFPTLRECQQYALMRKLS